jgi:hypothetical protein
MRLPPADQIKNYDNEDLFTTEVVVPLFKALALSNRLCNDGYGVWYWGKDKRSEGIHGIDVLFGFNDFLGISRHIAVLCKVIPISMGVNYSKNTSILTIQQQIRLAWGHKFTSPLNHKQSCINELILLTNKEISVDVLDHTWELEVNQYRNTYFWGIQKLESIVEKLTENNGYDSKK